MYADLRHLIRMSDSPRGLMSVRFRPKADTFNLTVEPCGGGGLVEP